MLIRIPEQEGAKPQRLPSSEEGDEIRWFRAFLLFLSWDDGRPVVRAPPDPRRGKPGIVPVHAWEKRRKSTA